MKLTVASSPHIRGNFRTSRLMLDVVIDAGTEVRYAHRKAHEQDQHEHSTYRLQRTAPAMHGVCHHTDEYSQPDQPYLREQRDDEVEDFVVEGDIDEIENSFIDDLEHTGLVYGISASGQTQGDSPEISP